MSPDMRTISGWRLYQSRHVYCRMRFCDHPIRARDLGRLGASTHEAVQLVMNFELAATPCVSGLLLQTNGLGPRVCILTGSHPSRHATT